MREATISTGVVFCGTKKPEKKLREKKNVIVGIRGGRTPEILGSRKKSDLKIPKKRVLGGGQGRGSWKPGRGCADQKQ